MANQKSKRKYKAGGVLRSLRSVPDVYYGDKKPGQQQPRQAVPTGSHAASSLRATKKSTAAAATQQLAATPTRGRGRPKGAATPPKRGRPSRDVALTPSHSAMKEDTQQKEEMDITRQVYLTHCVIGNTDKVFCRRGKKPAAPLEDDSPKVSRGRGRPRKNFVAANSPDTAEVSEDELPAPTTPIGGGGRGRGRPRKNVVATNDPTAAEVSEAEEPAPAAPATPTSGRGRGRPSKNKSKEAARARWIQRRAKLASSNRAVASTSSLASAPIQEASASTSAAVPARRGRGRPPKKRTGQVKQQAIQQQQTEPAETEPAETEPAELEPTEPKPVEPETGVDLEQIKQMPDTDDDDAATPYPSTPSSCAVDTEELNRLLSPQKSSVRSEPALDENSLQAVNAPTNGFGIGESRGRSTVPKVLTSTTTPTDADIPYAVFGDTLDQGHKRKAADEEGPEEEDVEEGEDDAAGAEHAAKRLRTA